MTKFNILEFIANNAGLSMVEAIEKAYELGKAETQPSEDCISREKVFEQISCWVNSGEYRYTNATYYLTRRIQGISPVTPKEKTGHWIDTGSGQMCSRCNEIQYGYDNFRRFCASCGAKMGVEE